MIIYSITDHMTTVTIVSQGNYYILLITIISNIIISVIYNSWTHDLVSLSVYLKALLSSVDNTHNDNVCI